MVCSNEIRPTEIWCSVQSKDPGLHAVRERLLQCYSGIQANNGLAQSTKLVPFRERNEQMWKNNNLIREIHLIESERQNLIRLPINVFKFHLKIVQTSLSSGDVHPPKLALHVKMESNLHYLAISWGMLSNISRSIWKIPCDSCLTNKFSAHFFLDPRDSFNFAYQWLKH